MASKISDYRKRRKRIIRFLGGSCIECKEKENLHVDHKDPKLKSFDVSANWARSWSVLKEELKKCQLLCVRHHKRKTRKEESWRCRTNTPQGPKHGTVWAYAKYKCRCDLCKLAKKNSWVKKK